MSLSNHERVGKALEMLKEGLSPFVERELKSQYGDGWFSEAKNALNDMQGAFAGTAKAPRWDVAAILAILWGLWNVVFRKTLGHAERSLVSELREVRNKWAHQNAFSSDDADRALDSAARLLTAVSAAQADEVGKLKLELRRLIFDEQMRGERRRSAGTAIENQGTG